MITTALFALLPLGLFSLLSRETRRGCAGFGPLALAAGMAASKLVSKFAGGKAANAKAKTEAKNQNAANAWKHKFDTANFETEKRPYYNSRDRSRTLRKQVQAAIMNNPKYGLNALFPGFAQYQKEVPTTANPYAVAGAPPPMAAATQGGASMALGSLADAAASGIGTYISAQGSKP